MYNWAAATTPNLSTKKLFLSKPLNETDLNQCIHDKNLSQSHGKGFKKCKKKEESIVYRSGGNSVGEKGKCTQKVQALITAT